MGDSYTIQISSNLIDRLVDEENNVKKKTKKPKPRAPEHKQQTVKKPVSDFKRAPKDEDWPRQPPLYLPIPHAAPAVNPELEAIRSVLQESERIVDRLQKQEDNKVQELTERAKELHEKEFKLPNQKPVPCLDESSACKKCYEEHLKNPLKCSDFVQRYVNCTRKERMKSR